MRDWDAQSVIFIMIVLVILSVTGSCTANNYFIDKRYEYYVNKGLQQCQGIGRQSLIWQRECLVPIKRSTQLEVK